MEAMIMGLLDPSAWTPRLLSVLRIVTAFIFMLHGTAKILHLPPLPRYEQLQWLSLGGVAGLLELVGGGLLLLGLFTRPVAFILSGEMAAAYFIAHAPRSVLPLLNNGDAAVLYCFVFLFLAAAGAGPWSIDAWRARSADGSECAAGGRARRDSVSAD
ncbi:MAG: DoxX family protein [Betaproteobacteria bacterium]